MTKMLTAWAALLLALAAGDARPAGPATRPPANATVICVEDMDCPNCARKVSSKVAAVAGVAAVDADTETSRLTVTPKGGASPSARALWEAVLKAGYKPTRLAGPSGSFTALPKD